VPIGWVWCDLMFKGVVLQVAQMKTFLHLAQVKPLFNLVQVPLYNNPEALAVMNRKLRHLKKKVRTEWIKEFMFNRLTYDLAYRLLEGYPAHLGRLPLYLLIAFFLAPRDPTLATETHYFYNSDDDSDGDDSGTDGGSTSGEDSSDSGLEE